MYLMTIEKKQKTFQKNPNAIPRLLINTGKALQFFSSEITVRYCAKLFTTPIRHKTPKGELLMLETSKKEQIKISEIEKTIQIYKNGSENNSEKILLVHGWSGRGTQLHKIAAALKSDYQVISFDGPAHGLSTGKTTIMPEFVKTIHAIDKKYGPFTAAIGHSFGGMALLRAKKENASFKKLITIGIADSIVDITTNFIKMMELKPKIAVKLKQFFDNKHQIDLETYASNISAKDVYIPTLVIHDKDDADVPVSCAINVRQNLKNGEMLLTKGLGHRRILKNKEVINSMITFIKS